MNQRAIKRCKPTHKLTYGFESCGEIKEMYKYGLCLECWKEWLKTPEGLKEALKCIPKAKKVVEKEVRKKTIKQKIDGKSIALLKLEAREPFQKLIRIRDYRKQCISCDKMLSYDIGSYHGGHYLKAELYNGIIFHNHNVNGQCIQCNKYFGGNESGYVGPLKERIGEKSYNALIELSIKLKDYEWDRHDLIELKKYYNQQLRMVESGVLDINDVDWSVGVPSL